MGLSKADLTEAEKAIEGYIRLHKLCRGSSMTWQGSWADAIEKAEYYLSQDGDGEAQDILRFLTDINAQDALSVFEESYIRQLADEVSFVRKALREDRQAVTDALLRKPDVSYAIGLLKHGYKTAVIPYSATERIGLGELQAMALGIGASVDVSVSWDTHRPHTDVMTSSADRVDRTISVAYMPTALLVRR